MTMAGRTVTQKLRNTVSQTPKSSPTNAHSHSEYTVLEVARPGAELQERQRNPQGDERMDEEAVEDVV